MAYLRGVSGNGMGSFLDTILQDVNAGITDVARIENDLKAAGFTDVSQTQIQQALNTIPGGTNTMLIIGGLVLVLLLMRR